MQGRATWSAALGSSWHRGRCLLGDVVVGHGQQKKRACLALGRREEKASRLGWLATGLKWALQMDSKITQKIKGPQLGLALDQGNGFEIGFKMGL